MAAKQPATEAILPVDSTDASLVSGQPTLSEQAEISGATTTDPRSNARAADAGVKVDPATGRVSESGPPGPRLNTEVARASGPIFVQVGEDFVLYTAGDFIPPEHRDLPTVAAEHRKGVWTPRA